MSRAILALIIAAVLLAGFGFAALSVPSTCPSGTRDIGRACVSLSTHAAPSSGIQIPDYSTDPRPQNALRSEIALAGVVLAAGVVWVSRREPHLETPEPA